MEHMSKSDHPAASGTGKLYGFFCGALIGFLVKDLGVLQAIPLRLSDNLVIVLCCLVGLGAAVASSIARRLMSAAATGLALLWVLVALTPVTSWMSAPLVRVDSLRAADAIVVLGSGMQGDGEFTTQSMSRLLAAMALFRQGYAPQMVLPELAPPHRRYRPAAERLASELDLSLNLTTIEPVSNTHEEALLLAELSRNRGWNRIIAVSSPTHLRRVGALIEKQGLEVITRPAVETRFDIQNLHRLNHHEDRVRSLGSVLHEYVGLAYYRLRGWI